jgi:hypothetical protein
VTEAEFLDTVIDLILDRPTLLWFHDWDSRRNPKGFPDLVIAGPGGVLWRELKVPGNSLSSEQTKWKWTLKAAGADWGAWYPVDLSSGLVGASLDFLALSDLIGHNHD